MAKQWAGRIVLTVQFICWFAVIGLLLHRGLINIQQKKINQIAVPSRVNVTTNDYIFVNEPVLDSQYQAGRGFVAGVVLICVAAVMLVVSPVFVLMKLLENRRRHRRMRKALERDQPPKYEDVVESAPRYSALFNISETGVFSLDDGKVKAIVKPEQVPLTSSD